MSTAMEEYTLKNNTLQDEIDKGNSIGYQALHLRFATWTFQGNVSPHRKACDVLPVHTYCPLGLTGTRSVETNPKGQNLCTHMRVAGGTWKAKRKSEAPEFFPELFSHEPAALFQLL